MTPPLREVTRLRRRDAPFAGVDFAPLEHLLFEIGDSDSRSNDSVERVVFLITKDHPERLRVTLPAIAASSDRLYVIDSSTGPETRRLCSDLDAPHVWYHGADEQRRVVAEKICLQRALDSRFITWLSEDCWDIWSKRNYALLYARLCGFSRVLLIDDDVIPPPGLIGESLDLAGAHKLVGAHVRGMPDVSVVGHLSALVGLTSQSFVSGHFLAVDVASTAGFYFADLYNEDWLFVLLNSISWPVARHGAIFQLYWNPYSGTEARAASEEFGEIVIEGVARSLLGDAGTARLDQLAHWNDVLAQRYRTLDELAASDLVASMPTCAAIMRSIREAASAVTAERCLSFWQTYQARLPEWRAQIELAGAEGAPR